MLIEQVAAGAHADEDLAAVAVVEDLGHVVEDAPAGDHVEFVAVVLDVRDAPAGGFRARGVRGGGAGWVEGGVVEMRGGGAEGVDFLRTEICELEDGLCYGWVVTYKFRDGSRGEFAEELVEDCRGDDSTLRVSDENNLRD